METSEITAYKKDLKSQKKQNPKTGSKQNVQDLILIKKYKYALCTCEE